MVLELTHYGQNILRKRTKRVEKFDKTLEQLVQDMFETMYEAEGVGLAANQVGIDRALATIDIAQMDEEVEPFVLINPEILDTDGSQTQEEGCLSIPGIREEVERADWIVVKYMNTENEIIEREARGLLARVIQHETDHLNGKFFIDHISPLKRRFLQRRLTTIAREGFQAAEE